MRILPPLACFIILAAPVRADDAIDSPMYRDPLIGLPPVVPVYPPGLVPLWLQALDRPETDLKCQAALTIAAAHRQGMPGLKATVPALLRELDRPSAHASVRAAAAQALVALDAKETAASLLKAGADDIDVRELVEPALARWAFAPARDEWLKRIASPPPHRRPAILAMRCLAAMREEKAAPRLRELALAADSPPFVRLEAARAFGIIRRSGGEADADALAADATPTGVLSRVAAASVLRHHDGAEAVRRLQTFAVDADPSVAAVALARLIEIDPKHVVPSLATVLASPDANVRSYGVDVLFREASEGHIRLLGDRLSDLHPEVRVKARGFLRELAAKPEFKTWVIAAGVKALAGSAWRGKEQAAVLLGHLDHKPAVTRLLELLDDPRPEVAVATGWALRVLAVPDTLPRVFQYVRTHTRPGDAAARRKLPAEALDNQLCQLCQFLGKSRHEPAEPVFREMIPPRPDAMPEARAAACWALGLFHEGEAVAPLVTAMAGRVAAVNPFDVEDHRVRQMCAASLGRMNARDALPTLRKFCPIQQHSSEIVHNTCGWAIEKITGEKMPAMQPIEATQRAWFLTPLDK